MRSCLYASIVVWLSHFMGGHGPSGGSNQPLPPEETQGAISLVSKGPGHFVHALPFPSTAGRLVHRKRAASIVLTHTDRKTGRMRYLTEATGTVTLNTRRVSYVQTRIVGILADDERLYVIRWRSRRSFTIPLPKAVLTGGTYRMHVFWLTDGSEIHDSGIPGAFAPRVAPPETMGSGPMRRKDGTVSCFGLRYRFSGKKRLD